MVNGMIFFDHCIIRNDKKTSFSLERYKGDIILEYIHIDLHGLEEIPLIDGARYVLSIVND